MGEICCGKRAEDLRPGRYDMIRELGSITYRSQPAVKIQGQRDDKWSRDVLKKCVLADFAPTRVRVHTYSSGGNERCRGRVRKTLVVGTSLWRWARCPAPNLAWCQLAWAEALIVLNWHFPHPYSNLHEESLSSAPLVIQSRPVQGFQ